TPPEISTIHDDLTYVLALAAGFSITDAKRLQIWDQLVDSEALPGAVVSYTNGGGAFYTPPNSNTICGGSPFTHTEVLWPRWGDVTISTSVTTRFGPYSPFFHFPHIDGALAQRDINALHDWGWGLTNTLVAYEAYAWGRPGIQYSTVMQATCQYTRTATITTTIAAGSLEAFATYLHSLADGYSHRDCIAVMDVITQPRKMFWATHTTPGIDPSVPECDYHPKTPTNTDVHGREFYTYTDSLRADAAIRAVYGELISRSLTYEGQYPPIDLNTKLTLSITETLTLDDALSQFVHNWQWDQPGDRRAWADKIARAALMQRYHVYLPIVIK
ncbi:MAG TPA: hypothetical protein VII92_01710, partial [Anaerolineae bacterium]